MRFSTPLFGRVIVLCDTSGAEYLRYTSDLLYYTNIVVGEGGRFTGDPSAKKEQIAQSDHAAPLADHARASWLPRWCPAAVPLLIRLGRVQVRVQNIVRKERAAQALRVETARASRLRINLSILQAKPKAALQIDW